MEFRYEPEADAYELVRWIETDEMSGKGILLTWQQVEQLSRFLASNGSDQRERVRRSLERALGEIDALTGKK